MVFSQGMRQNAELKKSRVDCIKIFAGDSSLSGDESRNRLLADCFIHTLFSGQMLSNSSIIRKLIVFLSERNVSPIRHESLVHSKTFASTTLHNSDLSKPLNQIDAYYNSLASTAGLLTRLTPNPIRSPAVSMKPTEPSEGNVSHYMPMRFKEENKKFSEILAECCNEFFAEYKYFCQSYMLSDEQKLNYLHNLRT